MRGPSRRAIPLLFVLLLAPLASAAEKEVARDDGKRAGENSVPRSGHVVSFEKPKGEWWVRAVRIHGSRYGGGYDPAATPFTVAVCDSGLKPLETARPKYDIFSLGKFEWVEVPLPRPVKVPRSFKVVVAFDPAASRGVYVAYSATEKSFSGYGLPGGSERAFGTEREWMIRAVLTDKAPKSVGNEVELKLDDGVKIGESSIQDGGHVIEFRKPPGKWWLKSIKLFGSQYGGGFDPAATPFSVTVTSPSMKPVHEEKGTYSQFPRGAFHWAELPLTASVKAPSRFRVAVSFDPHPTKGIYLGYSAAKRTHSHTGLPGARPTPFKKGEWMVRVILSKEKPQLPEPKLPEKYDPAIYLLDFDFLAKTVKARFPALEKKGVDWDAVTKEWRPRFASAKDDKTHVLNARRLMAILGDVHSRVRSSKVAAHVPAYDGLYGAGMWIASDRGRLVLRSLMPGHVLQGKIALGAELLTIDGRPAKIVREELRRRLSVWSGWSSTHFLDARLSWQFFPFGEKRTMRARFLNPDGGAVDVDLPRWGPRGRGLQRRSATLPFGLALAEGAVSTKLDADIGYVRILGSMNSATLDRFHKAFDALRGVKGILLDCRSMGGGGDGPAWEMCGRFHVKPKPLDRWTTLKPTGAWQFDGPVVMLQDEAEVSSAETFTWAMNETGRAVAVGRPTAGGTIIPRPFEVPSGMFEILLGVTDRRTPIRGIQPEGRGTPPDVFVPYEPTIFEKKPGPVLAVGIDVLRLLVAGAPREAVVDVYGGILGADPEKLRRSLAAFRKSAAKGRRKLDDLTGGLVAEMIEWEVTLCESEVNPMPDFSGARRRLADLAAVAEILGRKAAAGRAREAPRSWGREIAAQTAWEALVERALPPAKSDLLGFLEEHGETRYGKAVKGAF